MNNFRLTEEEKKILVQNFRRRQMDCHIFQDRDSAKGYLYSGILFRGCSIGFGRSMTFERDLNLYDELKADKDYHLIDRYDQSIPKEKLNAEMTNCDVFLMSSNAISKGGELVNIDGRGNRLSYLLYGPKTIVILAGTNKLKDTLEDALYRARNIAAPNNCIRLGKITPCRKTLTCQNCLAPDCICDSILVTRRSHEPFRIKILLIEETLGY